MRTEEAVSYGTCTTDALHSVPLLLLHLPLQLMPTEKRTYSVS